MPMIVQGLLKHLLYEIVRWFEVGQNCEGLASFKGRIWTESEISCILCKGVFLIFIFYSTKNWHRLNTKAVLGFYFLYSVSSDFTSLGVLDSTYKWYPYQRIMWWLPGNGEWGIGQTLFKCTNLQWVHPCWCKWQVNE